MHDRAGDRIDDVSAIEQSRVDAAPILGATRFIPGARYEDHREGDRSSGMGLRMLVLVAQVSPWRQAAKAGILVTILLALKKGLVAIGLAIAGLFKWLFGRKGRAPESVSAEAPPSE